MILTPDILASLSGLFEDVWIAKGGEEVNVTCPYCASRMGTGDSSGHLGLNFTKNAAHCVRCDWGTRGLREWLKKMGFAASLPAHIVQASMRDVRKLLDRPITPYRLGQCLLPPVRRISASNYSGPDAFARSLLDKRISLEEARRNALCSCDEGRYDGYVIFPFTEDGQIVYWQGRAAYPHLLADSKLKKRNPSDKETLFGKSYWLYGYDFARIGGTAVLVEGTLDQITTQSWIEGTGRDTEGWYCISCSGTALSGPDPERHPLNSQIGKIISLDPSEVIVFLDPEAWVKALGLVDYLRSYNINARAVRPPVSDPNDTLTEDFNASLGASELDALRHRIMSAPLAGSPAKTNNQPRNLKQRINSHVK